MTQNDCTGQVKILKTETRNLTLSLQIMSLGYANVRNGGNCKLQACHLWIHPIRRPCSRGVCRACTLTCLHHQKSLGFSFSKSTQKSCRHSNPRSSLLPRKHALHHPEMAFLYLGLDRPPMSFLQVPHLPWRSREQSAIFLGRSSQIWAQLSPSLTFSSGQTYPVPFAGPLVTVW